MDFTSEIYYIFNLLKMLLIIYSHLNQMPFKEMQCDKVSNFNYSKKIIMWD